MKYVTADAEKKLVVSLKDTAGGVKVLISDHAVLTIMNGGYISREMIDDIEASKLGILTTKEGFIATATDKA